MTSIPASRRARATTLTPRSWPSRPILARRTRFGGALTSEDDRLDVAAEDCAQCLDDLAARRPRAHGLDRLRHEILVALRSPPQLLEALRDGRLVAGRSEGGELADLALLGLGVDAVELEGESVLAGVAVRIDADDHPLAALLRALEVVGRVGDLLLGPARLDAGDRAPELVDLLEHRARLALDLVGQGLDREGAAERVDRRGDAALLQDDLLRPQRDLHRLLGGDREGLVHPAHMEGLGAAEHRGERLDRGARDVVQRLRRGQRGARGLA